MTPTGHFLFLTFLSGFFQRFFLCFFLCVVFFLCVFFVCVFMCVCVFFLLLFYKKQKARRVTQFWSHMRYSYVGLTRLTRTMEMSCPCHIFLDNFRFGSSIGANDVIFMIVTTFCICFPLAVIFSLGVHILAICDFWNLLECGILSA